MGKIFMRLTLKVAGSVVLCYMCIELIALPEPIAAMIMLTVGVIIGLSENDFED